MSALLISLLSFLLTATLVYTAQAHALDRRLSAGKDRAASSDPDFANPRLDPLPTVTRWLLGSEAEKRLRLAIIRGGLRLRPAEWIVICAVSAAAAGVLALLRTHSGVMGLLAGCLGLTGPTLLLAARQAARQRQFERQTPDMLMLMTASLRAGHSFAQAMEMVAAEMPPPLAAEFAWASGEARLGIPLELALGRMLERVPSSDLDLIVSAILIQLPLGGNLAEVLEAIAETIRERVQVQGEVRTLTAEGRLSALVLIVLAPTLALLLQLRSPDYFQPLLATSLGHGLILGAIVGQIVGAWIIKALVELDV